MKRPMAMLAAALLATLIVAPSARADFGLKDLDVVFENQDGSIATVAGSHPFAMTTTLNFETTASEDVGFEIPDGNPKNLIAEQMEGLVGNPSVVPTCSNSTFLADKCPASAQVGIGEVGRGEPGIKDNVGLYSLDPPPGVAMRLGFHVLFVPVTIDLGVNESPPYNVIASLINISNAESVYGSKLKLWGVPAAAVHDPERRGPGCDGGCSLDLEEKPFLTTPRACTGPLTTVFRADSWQQPGVWFEESILTHDESLPPNPQAMIGCGKLGFSPSITAQPTARAGSSPSGLDFSLEVVDEGLTNPDPEARANSDIRKAVVTLPEGFTANPALAEGLATCSEADLARERADSGQGNGCPNASKIGSVEVETPLLENKSINGSLYIATPYENPFSSLLALYMVIRNEELGILVRQPLEVKPDPVTGQLTTVADDLPQLPFSHFRLHFREGARSPLATPAACGNHEVKADLFPWSGGPSVTSTSTFQIITGPNAGPCPSGGLPPFRPDLLAGTLNNRAGSYSPFYVGLSRTDAEQEFTHFSIKLPPGVVGKLAGIPFCPDAAIAAAKARTGPHGGQEELDNPSCPAASEIGRTLVGSGVGPSPAYAPGKVYLAGPYNGSALSIAAITAARVGPFDLGTVVVREALRVNPETAEVFVDATGSDPIPHIIQGIPVHLKEVQVHVDRPQFMLNPTSCEPTSTASTLLGAGLDFGSAADNNPVTVSTRFQAADCGSLGFRPSLSLSLKGGTKRGKIPALKAVLTPRPGDANIGRAVVTLPASQFLEQSNIRTICTRVQFAEGAVPGEKCPPASIYGRAEAITPLLDEPVSGPVFMRANGGERDLPDLVAALHAGKIDVNLAGFIDSAPIKGQERSRIRTTFATPPDVPVTRFTLEMAGGKRGLLVNSTNICRGVHRAKADFVGQNGKRYRFNPKVKADCKKKAKRGRGR